MKKFLITIIVLFILMNVIGYVLNPEHDETKRKTKMREQATEMVE